MINEQVFRLKKNGEPYWNCYCRHPELIENYDKAIADTTQVWECHHRFEALFTKEQLIKYNWYFDVEPNCLIFLTLADHSYLHMKGKKLSEEHKIKMKVACSKKVLCVETGEIFESTWDAERRIGVLHNHISHACNGKRKTAGGLHWKFCN